MKKVLLIALLLVYGVVNAQNYFHVNITEIENWHTYEYCASQYDGVVIEKESGCDSWAWHVSIGGQTYLHAVDEFDEITLEVPANLNQFYAVTYFGCNTGELNFEVRFIDFQAPEPWAQDYQWKRIGASIQLNAYGGYNYQWSTGSTNSSITVTEPGTYWVRIYNDCGELSDTIRVQDNVNLYRATVDLATGLNKVTWHTTPEQAEYISQVKVERDGMVVGTAPYEDGQFIDNIGSENAARNYRLTAITAEGDECPIPSYQYGTLHVDYSPNASNPNKLNMAWTPPFIEEGASISVSYFQICKYDPATNEVTVVDQLGANNTIGSYDVSLFDGGYAVVAAMFDEGKEYEELAFSNLTDFLVGIEENEGQQCKVYPNPAKDCFTVEGTGTMTVTNTLGQTVVTQEIDGKTTIELPQGMYFVKLGGATRKVVVE